MNDDLYIKCCETLEVSPEASMGEIKRSYLYLKEFYSVDSIATMALDDEFSASDKTEILEEIEQAYHTLMTLVKQERDLPDSDGGEPCDDKAVAAAISGVDLFDGPALKQIRKKMGVALDNIAMATRIQVQYLTCLEDENFDGLPAEVYTRGFISSYAEFLSLDVQKVVTDYMARYRKWKSDHHPGGTLATLFSLFKQR